MIGDIILTINRDLISDEGIAKVSRSVNITRIKAGPVSLKDVLFKVEFEGMYDRTFILGLIISSLNPLAPPSIGLVYHGKFIDSFDNKKPPSKILRKIYKGSMAISKEEVKRGFSYPAPLPVCLSTPHNII